MQPRWILPQIYEDFRPSPVGLYRFSDEGKALYENLDDDQTRLRHMLGCRTWPPAWQSVRQEIGPDLREGWWQKLWQSAVLMQGVEGLRMLRPGGMEMGRERLLLVRAQIEQLSEDDRPRVHAYERMQHLPTDAPNLVDEVEITWAGS